MSCLKKRGYRCSLTGMAVQSAFCANCDDYEGPPRGAGDLVHTVAQPIAGAIDATLGTNVKGCIKCKKRRKDLNKKIPFGANQ